MTATLHRDDDPRALLWSAVDEALDVGADVLEDARVQAWLVEHPEDLASVDELLARLQVMATGVAASHTSPLRYAASIGLLGFVLIIAWRAVAVGGASAPAVGRADRSPVAVAEAPRARVLTWSVRSTSVGAAGQVEHVARPGGDARRAGTTRRPGSSLTDVNPSLQPSQRGRVVAASFRSSTWSSH